MDILYFQGVRPFSLGEEEPSWTSFTSNAINRCLTSADPYEGAPSAVPATQNEPEVLKLPSYMQLEDVKTTLSCEASLKK